MLMTPAMVCFWQALSTEAFDSFHWCMDEFVNVHVTEVGKAMGLGKYEGKRLNLHVDRTA